MTFYYVFQCCVSDVSCIINSADALSYRDASDAAPAAAAAVNVLSSSNYDFVPIFFRSKPLNHACDRPSNDTTSWFGSIGQGLDRDSDIAAAATLLHQVY